MSTTSSGRIDELAIVWEVGGAEEATDNLGSLMIGSAFCCIAIDEGGRFFDTVDSGSLISSSISLASTARRGTVGELVFGMGL